MRIRDSRQQILDATQRLIESTGILHLTTKEIAQEAACAEGTLFRYFKTKEDIILAVVLENSPKFREVLATVCPGTKTVAENLKEILLAAMTFFEKLVPLGASLLADVQLMKRHRTGMQKSGRGPKDVFDLVTAYIESEQKFSRIANRVSPESAACLLLGPCFHRVFIRQAMGKDLIQISDTEFVSALISTLSKGLGRRIDNPRPVK